MTEISENFPIFNIGHCPPLKIHVFSSNLSFFCSVFIQAAPFTGQWQEASLGDQQRNDKFFRLMGGFKKSNTADEKKAAASSSFAFKALDAKRQERLYKGLEHQYDQAFQTTKMNRGKGLGFS